MHVIVELLTGDQAGRRVRLVSRQVLRVGRSAHADLVIEDDPQLAEHQFVLATDAYVCRLQSLAASPPTCLNDQPVTSTVVRDGDRIQAGASSFLVQIQGDAPGEAANEPVRAEPIPAARRAGADGAVQVEVQYRLCDSGAVYYQGPTARLPPGELAGRLAQLQPMFAIVDFRRLPDAVRPDSAQPDYLFDWLGEAAAQNSPVILAQDETDLLALVEKGWGKNGLVCLFGTLDKPALVQHLRQAARVGSDCVVGLCWPAILAPLLERYRADYVRGFLGPLTAVLVEVSEPPESWRLFAKQPLQDLLGPLGLKLPAEASPGQAPSGA